MTTHNTEPTLNAIQVFSNSANSVRVFEALTDGLTTSKALAERTGASRSTVARILDKGESRGWIDSVGSRYELTDTGQIMIEEFRAYRQTVEGVQHLGEAISWLPPPARELDFCHFRDAELIRPSDTNPVKPFDYLAELIRAADEKRSLTRLAVRRFVKMIHERCAADRLRSESVIEASWFDALAAEPAQIPIWRARAERGSVLVYDGNVPVSLHLIDDKVLIWLSEEEGDEMVIRALVVTENPAVVSWAESLYEEFRTAAEPLDRATLPEA